MYNLRSDLCKISSLYLFIRKSCWKCAYTLTVHYIVQKILFWVNLYFLITKAFFCYLFFCRSIWFFILFNSTSIQPFCSLFNVSLLEVSSSIVEIYSTFSMCWAVALLFTFLLITDFPDLLLYTYSNVSSGANI